jgi:hypothetical protein
MGGTSGHVIDGTDVNDVTGVTRSNCEAIATFVTEIRSTIRHNAGSQAPGERCGQNIPAQRRRQAG